MSHKVDNRLLTPYLKGIGRNVCKDLTPYTLVTPFRVTPVQKSFFPARTSFVYREDVDEIYLFKTSDWAASSWGQS